MADQEIWWKQIGTSASWWFQISLPDHSPSINSINIMLIAIPFSLAPFSSLHPWQFARSFGCSSWYFALGPRATRCWTYWVFRKSEVQSPLRSLPRSWRSSTRPLGSSNKAFTRCPFSPQAQTRISQLLTCAWNSMRSYSLHSRAIW